MESRQISPDVTFITFYTPLSRQQLEDSLRAVTDLKAKWKLLPPMFEDWRTYLNVFFSATKRSHPHCENVLLTDETTSIDLPEDVRIVRYPVNQERIMYEKLCIQIEFMKADKTDNHLVFLDNDMIVQDSLEQVFEQQFDVGFTYMFHHTGTLYALPISNGVIIVPSRSRKKAIRFFEEVKAIYEEHFFKPELLKWQGGEYAIKKRIGIRNIDRVKAGILEVDDYRILLLDPAIYNFTSDDFFEMKDYYPDKKILHFKHMRKPEMPIYWELHLRDL